jgi:hypothetical protein
MHIGPSARRRNLTAAGAVVVALQLALAPAAATQWVADLTLWCQGPVIDHPGCRPGPLNAWGADMRLVESALTSSERLWSFITAPDTGYFERRGAASRAGRLFPPEWVPRIVAAQREISAEASLHCFGLYDRLESGRRISGSSPRDGLLDPRRVILGHVFVVPVDWVPYPLTDDGLKRLPWPSQVSAALEDLVRALTREGDANAIDSVALTLPCTDSDSRRVMVDLTHGVAAWQGVAPPAVFGTWLNLLRRHDVNVASLGLQPQGLSQINAPMAEVLALEYLARGQFIEFVASRDRPAVLLASLRLVLSRDYQRRQSSLSMVAYFLNEMAIKSAYIPSKPSNDAAEDYVDSISRWFRQVEPELERLAELDRPRLDAARRQMEAAGACRP